MTRPTQRRRKGAILVLAAVMMAGMMAVLAFAVDLGVIMVARHELQRSADSAALAGAWELIDEEAVTGWPSASSEQEARAKAEQFAFLNSVLSSDPLLADEDVTIGYMTNPSDPNEPLDTTGAFPPNAVRVRVRRSTAQNGSVPLFFARVMGLQDTEVEAYATAAVRTNFGGFRTPSNGSNLAILPYALDEDTWNGLLAGVGADDFHWDPETKSISSGSDGILEVNLFPQGTGSPGNRGTVDIGSSNNSTADIARQILHGISPQDMEHHGGKLEFDDNGELDLNGDTGISAGVKDELTTIMGEPRIIPIFSQVQGPGNNAQYTIVKFAGIRIMEVKLTGKMSSKRVMVQPANVISKGAIPGPTTSSSYFVYSPAWLVR